MGTKDIPATPASRRSATSPTASLFRWKRYTLAAAGALCGVLCLLYFFSPFTVAAQDIPGTAPAVDSSAVSLGFTQSPSQEEKNSPAPLPQEQVTAPLSQEQVTAPLSQEQVTAPVSQSQPTISQSQEPQVTTPLEEASQPPLAEQPPSPTPVAVVEQRLPPFSDETEQGTPNTSPPPSTPDTPVTPAASPAKAAGAAASKDNTRLFGTIEMRASTKELRQWQDVQKRHADNPVFVQGFKLNASTSWDKLKSMLQDKPALEKIRGVNSFWNQWPYKLDKAVYGKEDYWAAPYEFRKNSGDCEDYAIAKYYTLKELGFSVEQMRIVVLKDTILNVAHAILAVYLDDDIYILDNIAKNVLSHTRIRNYLPVYSVNEQYRWVHMRTSK